MSPRRSLGLRSAPGRAPHRGTAGAFALLVAAGLSACASSPPPAADAQRLAGVDRAALISVTGRPDLYLAVYRGDLIDAAQLAAMPANLCAETGATVRSTKDRPPYRPAEYPAATRLLFVECAS